MHVIQWGQDKSKIFLDTKKAKSFSFQYLAFAIEQNVDDRNLQATNLIHCVNTKVNQGILFHNQSHLLDIASVMKNSIKPVLLLHFIKKLGLPDFDD